MPYLIYDIEGNIRGSEFPNHLWAEKSLETLGISGGVDHYDELSEVFNYWYPGGIKTTKHEIIPMGHFTRLKISDTFRIENLPEGCSLNIIPMLSLTLAGATSLQLKFSKYGRFRLLISKLGYHTYKKIITVLPDVPGDPVIEVIGIS